MKDLCFFNHYHNGDLFHSKGFVQSIMDQLPVQYYYAHFRHPKVLQDMNVKSVRIQGLGDRVRILDADDFFLVNTWIGAYSTIVPNFECTLLFNHRMYLEIYVEISKKYDVELKYSDDPLDYLPTVDYNKFDISKIDEFLFQHSGRKKVLISNGPALSGQCSYNDDMSDIIRQLAVSYPDVLFIPTHQYPSSLENVVFTYRITGDSMCDLNEISYLSKFCDLIVGRDSGPFCFTNTRENLMDSNKRFLSFGSDPSTCFMRGLESKIAADFHIVQFTNEENLGVEIENLLT